MKSIKKEPYKVLRNDPDMGGIVFGKLMKSGEYEACGVVRFVSGDVSRFSNLDPQSHEDMCDMWRFLQPLIQQAKRHSMVIPGSISEAAEVYGEAQDAYETASERLDDRLRAAFGFSVPDTKCLVTSSIFRDGAGEFIVVDDKAARKTDLGVFRWFMRMKEGSQEFVYVPVGQDDASGEQKFLELSWVV